MKFTKVCVLVGLLIAVLAFSPAPAHAQYTGGNPPAAGPNSGPPTGGPSGPSVLGQTFTNTGTHHSSSSSFLGLSWSDIATTVGGIAAISLIWLFFIWKRRKEDEDEEDASLGGAAPA